MVDTIRTIYPLPNPLICPSPISQLSPKALYGETQTLQTPSPALLRIVIPTGLSPKHTHTSPEMANLFSAFLVLLRRKTASSTLVDVLQNIYDELGQLRRDVTNLQHETVALAAQQTVVTSKQNPLHSPS